MLRTELIDTIRAIHDGRRKVQAEIAADIAGHIAMDDLTSREVEVLRRISSGSSNKIAAADLGISEDTVKGHMKNILSKLGANDRTHAVLIAMKRGFLDGRVFPEAVVSDPIGQPFGRAKPGNEHSGSNI